MKTPWVKRILWEMVDLKLGTWLDSPDSGNEEPDKPYTSYVVDFTTFCPVEDPVAILKFNDLLSRSGVPEHHLKEIFQNHPDFVSCPVRCRILSCTESYDPYTAFVFHFIGKQIVIFIPWDWNKNQLLMRSNPALEEPELGTFIGKTFRYLKAFPLHPAPQTNSLIRLLKRKLWHFASR